MVNIYTYIYVAPLPNSLEVIYTVLWIVFFQNTCIVGTLPLYLTVSSARLGITGAID